MYKAEEHMLRRQYAALSKGELIDNLIHWRRRFTDDLATVNADARVVSLRRRVDELERCAV